jgi:Secretion system C-terminal sorting domain
MKKVLQSSFFLFVALLVTQQAVAQDVIIWGGAGNKDSEFAGGLNGWTANGLSSANAAKADSALWVWKANATPNQGSFGTGAPKIKSASAANGCVVFDSDYLDNRGKSDGTNSNAGNGPCPGPQIGELVSPVIDLKGEKFVSVVFNNLFRNFDAITYICYSNDGGVTWADTVQVNATAAVNGTPGNDVLRVGLPKATGGNKFVIKFVFDGNYYYWAIDDVKIVRREKHNMKSNSNWFAIAPNLRTIKSQVEAIPFVNDISNLGASTETNVKLNVSISKYGGGNVFSSNLEYGDIAADSVAENKISEEYFLPDAKAAKYRATYSVQYDSLSKDFAPADNKNSFTFEVTDSVFAKENGRTRAIRPGDGNWGPGEAHSWAMGNFFYCPKGSLIKATNCEWGLNSGKDGTVSLKGRPVNIWLYEWADANEDGMVQVAERSAVGFGSYEIKGTENKTKIKTRLLDLDDKPIIMKDETAYLLMVDYQTTDDNDMLLEACDTIDYEAAVWASQQIVAPRYAGILGIGETSAADYSTRGFGRDLVPMVRLYAKSSVVDVKEDVLAETTVSIFPNPVSDQLNLLFDLPKPSDAVMVSIIDATGKRVLLKNCDTISKEKVSINVSDLPAGAYMMHVHTDMGMVTKAFVKQ